MPSTRPSARLEAAGPEQAARPITTARDASLSRGVHKIAKKRDQVPLTTRRVSQRNIPH